MYMEFIDGSNSLCAKAWESFFKKPSANQIENDKIYCSKTRCAESIIVPGQNGVFAREDLKKGECFEWGLATVIVNYDINNTDVLYTWSSVDKKKAATLSGFALYYNTNGDNSNIRCVPYHTENRYEMYALEDIPKSTELTIRYDSTNWRESFKDLKSIIGPLNQNN